MTERLRSYKDLSKYLKDVGTSVTISSTYMIAVQDIFARDIMEDDLPDFDDDLEEEEAAVLFAIGAVNVLARRGLPASASTGLNAALSMSRDTFEAIVRLLEADPIFQSKGRKPQRPVRMQLACFLMRYGTRGSDARGAAHRMGIGFGTVFLYCRRVAKALRRLGLDYAQWGGEDRRERTATNIEAMSGFPNCIGVVDGTLIRLTGAPQNTGGIFYCRKKFPAITVQAVVDEFCRFLNFELGWPGSVPDSSMWKQSWVWLNRVDLFGEDQYVMGDKVRPFNENEISHAADGAERKRMRSFNKELSGVRAWVEQAFGRLKARFPSLKEIGTPDDMSELYNAVAAMMSGIGSVMLKRHLREHEQA
ncbi:uncharacterized protein STEHIDRAFT_107036 [Stereum hirsutum FP-91666 SS1]|uniref:uncharacterized protein n=1 Tax=Stereum hirsutum (strain FP-91666) TaxID=721885 RepID=UPI000440A954|nr:uncharacterized protein STEHIDRAFT_107036 [Stereum hirsutum FP-91666 SS1]EIM92557.1 hypothetical protein STEHIDRAFT_107036 [Stereum hirsutum FP-91666 SS1]